MTPGRLKGLSLLVLLALSGSVMLAWSQPWFLLRLAGQEVDVDGQTAAGALAPLALSGLLVVPALAIAGPAFRVVLGVLQALLGVCIAIQAQVSLGDPVAASAGLVAELTGDGGADAARRLTESAAPTPWPLVALAAGIALVAAGFAVAATSRAWPSSARRYQPVRFAPVDGEAPEGVPVAEDGPAARADRASEGVRDRRESRAVEDWDALSGGDDPTDRDR
ncbi:Trp biosynthesis-associated membrane protein [Homoserinibacter sp. YIM 151385]|uniref:Trp biosynthesis-associated membrane protein n=1 Tax=Homoserinibacter sp. YIM 151385 TaxID=2985506 RepID=UPI0022F0F3E7|nr:Trp biosynthesis-associated membrane protein [Homoserinibacter sp. YIM 151385]WBU38637.1 Trp biosynthesis-associated membrane protein [Homoserinibacter sp. YIM 151385]